MRFSRFNTDDKDHLAFQWAIYDFRAATSRMTTDLKTVNLVSAMRTDELCG